MTIEELMKNFTKLKVINSNADLTRKVYTIESTETPDVSSFLPKHTLLLTTAMTYKNNQEGLCELITTLNELPCAGLAIKLGRFVNTLQPEVIATADKLGFPLIQIPIDMTLGEVYHQLLARIWNDQNEDLTYALNTQKKFSNLILQGASIEAMLNNLGFSIERPVAILNPFGEVLSSNYTCTQCNLNTAIELFERYQLHERRIPEIQHYEDREHGKSRISIYSIKLVGNNSYYLYIFDSEKLSTTMSTLVVEQVLLILGILLYKSLYVYYNDIRYKEEFLNILVNKYKNENWSAQQMLTVGAKFGLKSCAYYTAIVGTLQEFEDKKFNSINFTYREEKYILIYFWIESLLEKTYHGDIVLLPESTNYRFVLIVQGNCKGVKEKLKYIYDTISKMLQTEIIFSIGNNMLEIDSIVYSYNEALESYNDGEERDNQAFIKYYKPKSAMELLKTIPNDQVEKFCLHTLKTLAYPKDEMMSELQKTLRVYLDCSCSITETANRMFLHRNTVKYRIKKCEEIIGKDLSHATEYFQIQLSLVLVENK